MKLLKTKLKRNNEDIYEISLLETKEVTQEKTPSEVKDTIAKLILRKEKQEENLEQMQGAIVRIDQELELLNQAINLINK